MCGSSTQLIMAIPFVANGGGAVLTAGAVGSFPKIPFSFQILEWSLESPLAGNITWDILAAAFAAGSYPAVSIVAAAPPTMAASKAATSTALTGWTVNFAANTSLAFAVSGIATIQICTLSLKISRNLLS